MDITDPKGPPDQAALRKHKLWLTVHTLVIAWGVLWTVGYASLVSDGEGPGDASSWLLVGLMVWGPLGALHLGRAYLDWFRAPQ